MHNLSAAQALLRLRDSFGNDWFPSTVAYVIVRSMFETDVTAHYISQDPKNRSTQYIEFEHILCKRAMEVHRKHRKSKNAQWREAMNIIWQELAPIEKEIDIKYTEVISRYETSTKKGKKIQFQNWAGKSIRQMAIEVDHEEAYDVFYADLSSFTHVDVRLVNRFLHIRSDGLLWSLRSNKIDVGNVFRYAAIFMTCFLEFFGEQYKVWTKDDVHKCWDFSNRSQVELGNENECQT